MLPKCLVFAFRTPFIRRNTWPLTISTVRFPSFLIRASFVWVTLILVIAKDEIYKFIVLCSIPPIRNKIGDESPTVKVSITSAVRITSTAISCSNFGVVIHKLLWWSLQTFVAIFTNFSSDSYKLLPRCLQTVVLTFINFCRVVHKLLPWILQTLPCCSQTLAFILLVVHKLFEAMFTETFPWELLLWCFFDILPWHLWATVKFKLTAAN